MQFSFKNQHLSSSVLCDSTTGSQGEVGRIDELADPKQVLLDFHMSISLSALHSNSCSRNRISQLERYLGLGLRLGVFRVFPVERFLKCLLWLLGLLRQLLAGLLSHRWWWLLVSRFWRLVNATSPLSITEAAKHGQCHKAHGSTFDHHGFATMSALHSSLGAVRKVEMCTHFYNTVSMFSSITFPPLLLAIPDQTWWA